MSLSSEAIAALLASPALAPPESVTPEFDSPPNQNSLAWFVTTFCMVVATICLFLRAYTKLWIERRPKFEEGGLSSREEIDGCHANINP
jgi:hypothetical protein